MTQDCQLGTNRDIKTRRNLQLTPVLPPFHKDQSYVKYVKKTWTEIKRQFFVLNIYIQLYDKHYFIFLILLPTTKSYVIY